MDCKILLYNTGLKNYQELAVKGGEDLLVKIYDRTYHVADINSTEIDEEEAIVSQIYNDANLFVISSQDDTEDNPEIIDLTNVIEKYSIAPADISGEPDYQWHGDDAISDDKQVNNNEDKSSHNDNKGNADTKTDSAEKESSNADGIVAVCIGGAAIIAGVAVFLKIKGKK